MKNKLALMSFAIIIFILASIQVIYSYTVQKPASYTNGQIFEASIRGHRYQYKVIEFETIIQHVDYFPNDSHGNERFFTEGQRIMFSFTGGDILTYSIGENLPALFEKIVFTYDTGKIMNNSQGSNVQIFIPISDNTINRDDLYKLYVEDEVAIHPYKIMRRNCESKDSQWQFFSKGFKSEIYSSAFDFIKIQ